MRSAEPVSGQPADLPVLPKVVLFIFWSALLHLVLLFVLDEFLRGSVPGKSTVLQLRLAALPAVRPMPAMPGGNGPSPPAHREDVGGTKSATANPPQDVEDAAAAAQAGTDYYRESNELDVQPVPLGTVMPLYPDEALEAGLAGYVDLQILIDETGAVHSIEVIDDNPHGVFDEAALAAFGAVTFAPGQKGLVPVKSRIVIRVNFDAGPPAE